MNATGHISCRAIKEEYIQAKMAQFPLSKDVKELEEMVDAIIEDEEFLWSKVHLQVSDFLEEGRMLDCIHSYCSSPVPCIYIQVRLLVSSPNAYIERERRGYALI